MTDTSLRPLWIAFEAHFLGCKVCTLSVYCGDGRQLRAKFDTAAAGRAQATGSQPAPEYRRGRKQRSLKDVPAGG